MPFSMRYVVCFFVGFLVALMLSLGIGAPDAAVATPPGLEAAIAPQPALNTSEATTWRNLSHQEPNFYQ